MTTDTPLHDERDTADLLAYADLLEGKAEAIRRRCAGELVEFLGFDGEWYGRQSPSYEDMHNRFMIFRPTQNAEALSSERSGD